MKAAATGKSESADPSKNLNRTLKKKRQSPNEYWEESKWKSLSMGMYRAFQELEVTSKVIRCQPKE